MSPTPVRIAGYQGKASIHTAALQALAQSLDSRGFGQPVQLQPDVTADGESAASLFASLESGGREIAYMASGYLSHRVPELGVIDLPFCVQDRGAAMGALDGEVGRMLRAAVTRATGLHVLGFWDNGFRHVSNALRPIRKPADCAGLVIRTLDNADYRALLGALGFQPVTTDVKELVAAVESGRVQAQENPLTNLLSFGLWRHHPHVSLTGHLFGVLLLACPARWWQSLCDADRRALSEAVDAATAQQRRDAAAQDVLAGAELRARGVQVLAANEIDLPALRDAAEPLAARQRARLPEPLLRAWLGAQGLALPSHDFLPQTTHP